MSDVAMGFLVLALERLPDIRKTKNEIARHHRRHVSMRVQKGLVGVSLELVVSSERVELVVSKSSYRFHGGQPPRGD